MGDHDADWALNILREAGANTLAIHRHPVDPHHNGVRRIGPVRDAMSTVQSLNAFIRRKS
jgi:hypothetical protein